MKHKVRMAVIDKKLFPELRHQYYDRLNDNGRRDNYLTEVILQG